MRKRLGLIVNPIAGMGGAVGLKGTDGAARAEAERRGARPTAPERAAQALSVLAGCGDHFSLLTVSGAMGEVDAQAAGIASVVVHASAKPVTEAADTIEAALAMRKAGIDLLLFAGGDGTARDIFSVMGGEIPMLGIPAGVKMHSAVFATSPRSAGRLVSALLESRDPPQLREAEVVDSDGPPGALRLHGYARTPHVALLRQAAKAASRADPGADLEAVCRDVAAAASDAGHSIVGPGTTMHRVKSLMGGGTLLGIDVYRAGKPVACDVGAADLLRFAAGGPARIIVGVIGGQGCLFGRGNQQISPAVLSAVGRERIQVVAALDKLLALEQQSLFVDTGDEAVDRMLSGYIGVLTGPERRTMVRVIAPTLEAVG